MRNKRSDWEKAKEYGIDTSLLELNLSRTPTERVLALQNALNFSQELQKAGMIYYAKLRKAN